MEQGLAEHERSPESPPVIDNERLERLLQRSNRFRRARWPAPPRSAEEALDLNVPQPTMLEKLHERDEKPLGDQLLEAWKWRWAIALSMFFHATTLTILGWAIVNVRQRDDDYLLVVVASSRAATDLEQLKIRIAPPSAYSNKFAESLVSAPTGAIDDPPLAGAAPASLPLVAQVDSPASLGRESTLLEPGEGKALVGEGLGSEKRPSVKGRGQSFVFVVDASEAMESHWPLAVEELKRLIARLGPTRRFYVILFDDEQHSMFAEETPLEAPVAATRRNIEQLEQWLSSVAPRGKAAPTAAFRRALEIGADGVYVLSSGSFPDASIDHLRDNNRIVEEGRLKMPASVVHAIGYGASSGLLRMRRIAHENGGDYQSGEPTVD